jgi:hypothetical protein
MDTWMGRSGRPVHCPGPIEPVSPPGRAVIVGDVAAFDSGPLTSSLPLQGSAHVVFDEKGDFTFTCHAHDSGFDNIDYTVAAVILTQSGIALRSSISVARREQRQDCLLVRPAAMTLSPLVVQTQMSQTSGQECLEP